MIKRHEDALSARIDEVQQRGWTFVAWWEIYLWYNVERVTKKIWRDLRDRFNEGSPDSDLHIYEGDAAGFLLIHSDTITSVNKKLGVAEAEVLV